MASCSDDPSIQDHEELSRCVYPDQVVQNSITGTRQASTAVFADPLSMLVRSKLPAHVDERQGKNLTLAVLEAGDVRAVRQNVCHHGAKHPWEASICGDKPPDVLARLSRLARII
jgi:hypothetical protein